MARRPARQRRALRLWSSGWLALFLVLGLLWIGDTPLQWAVLGIPLLWALPALLSRGREPDGRHGDDPYLDDDPYGHHDPYGHQDRYGHRDRYGHQDPFVDDDRGHLDPYRQDDMDTREVRYTRDTHGHDPHGRDPHGHDAHGHDPFGRDDDPDRRGGYGSPR